MDYLYIRVRDAEFHINSPERAAFRKHLMLVSKALGSIEWNDSGDGDDQEVHNITACISPSASENDKLRAEVERLREEMQSAKADAWEDGYEAHRQMIEGIARKPSNPYR